MSQEEIGSRAGDFIEPTQVYHLLSYSAAFYRIRVSKGSFLIVNQHVRVLFPVLKRRIYQRVNLGNHEVSFIYILGIDTKQTGFPIYNFSGEIYALII